MTKQRTKEWGEVGHGKPECAEIGYVVEQGHHCILGMDKASVVQAYFQSDQTDEKSRANFLKLLEVALLSQIYTEVFGLAPLNADELIFTQFILVLIFTGGQSLRVRFILTVPSRVSIRKMSVLLFVLFRAFSCFLPKNSKKHKKAKSLTCQSAFEAS